MTSDALGYHRGNSIRCGRLAVLFLAAVIWMTMPGASAMADALPSWNDGASKARIIEYVKAVTTPGSEDFVPEAERIAVFDNDGCLWSEQPLYFQLFFAMDRVRALAPEHPEWLEQQPFKAVFEGDMAALAAEGVGGALMLVMATHGGITTEQFAGIANEWLASARHPVTGQLYSRMIFQPMVELLAYLRASGFQTWIVSGGGIDFIRAYSEEAYGIPPEQVVGSSVVTHFGLREGVPVIVRESELNFIDDKEGKPVAIQSRIGRRPILAFGNSDGDLQMLQWTSAGSHRSLAGLIRHTDAEREWAYDRESHVGRLDKALDEAGEKNWLVVDMAEDWSQVYPESSED